MLKTVPRLFIYVCLALAPIACTAVAEPTAEPQPLPIFESWSGTYPLSALDLLPAAQRGNASGYIGNPQTFAAVWQAFMPGEELPEVDFATRLVIFYRNVRFFNRTNIVQAKLTNGRLELLAIETMTARPITDTVAMALATVPREGVRFILLPGGEEIPVKD